MVAVFKDFHIPGIEVIPCRLTGPRGVVKSFLLQDGGSLALVDAGASDVDADLILQRLTMIGRSVSDLQSCIITHWHGDHIGGLKKLRSLAEFPVIAHEDEASAIEAGSGVRVDPTVRDADTIPTFGGLQVIHAPGHTAGNIALHIPRASTLLVGDTIFSAGGHLVLPPNYLTDDPDQARESVRRILAMELPVERLLVSHGEDVYEGAPERMASIFVPRRGG